MIKLAALGALGYAGYKYFQKNSNQSGHDDAVTAQNAAAGGPLSDKATVHPTTNSPVK
ncbi:MAG: hypothetical protein KKC79_16730 [Gammaproteobacteria bacterium]|nr:hypothetical protein [Gammaproteobacteria bacterium]